MPLSYDGTGRSVALAEALGDPGTPLAGTRADRADANYRNAWIKDNNPSWYAGDGLINMNFMNAQVPLAERDPKIDNSVPENSGDGLVCVRKLPL
jgi:hypothetical protein